MKPAFSNRYLNSVALLALILTALCVIFLGIENYPLFFVAWGLMIIVLIVHVVRIFLARNKR